MDNQTELKIECIFKYLDLCLVLLYKEGENRFFNYLIKKENVLIKYYNTFKLLSLEKYSNHKNYKEISSFIYYILSLQNKDKNDKIKNYNESLELKINQINEYKFQGTSEFYDITFSIKNNKIDNEGYNKIVIFCFDNQTAKYYFQDIIDLNIISYNMNEYKLRVNKNIFFVPLKFIPTRLYSFDISNDDNSINFKEYEEITKYSWNIGFNEKNILLLSEEDNKIYNFIKENDKDENTFSININKHIELFNTKTNPIIKLEDYSPFAYEKNGKVLFVAENTKNYSCINRKKQGIIFPIKIPNVKIINISATQFECYAIGDDGNLYENIGINYINFIKIVPPENEILETENNNKFIQCSCGEGYLLCIYKNKNGKSHIYSKGRNDNYQCGIN